MSEILVRVQGLCSKAVRIRLKETFDGFMEDLESVLRDSKSALLEEVSVQTLKVGGTEIQIMHDK